MISVVKPVLGETTAPGTRYLRAMGTNCVRSGWSLQLLQIQTARMSALSKTKSGALKALSLLGTRTWTQQLDSDLIKLLRGTTSSSISNRRGGRRDQRDQRDQGGVEGGTAQRKMRSKRSKRSRRGGRR